MAKKKKKNESTRSSKPAAGKTRQAMGELDRIFHEKARLGILTTIIATPDELNFNEIKDLCGLTDGNLNRHLKVLIDSKILSVKKTGSGRNTNSQYRMTDKGRQQFSHYLEALETILKAAQVSTPKPSPAKRKPGGGLAPASG